MAVILFSLVIFAFQVNVIWSDYINNDEDNAFSGFFSYNENKNMKDPNDMFGGAIFEENEKIQAIESNVAPQNILTEKCDDCWFQLSEMKKKQHDTEETVKILSKDYNKDNLNISLFYDRVIRMMLSHLQLESEDAFKDEPLLQRQLSVKIDQTDLSILQTYLKDHRGIHLVDMFFQNNFEFAPLQNNSFLLGSFLQMEHLSSFELWIDVLSVGFIVFAMWAFCYFAYLTILRPQFYSVLLVLFSLLFGIGYLWTWRLLVKETASQYNSNMMKRNFDVPLECKPEYARSYWGYITSYFQREDPCERYFKESLIDPHHVVSPLYVLSETATKFILHPLSFLGTQMGLFFANFYGNMTFLTSLPATLMLIVVFGVLLVILLACLGHDVSVPFISSRAQKISQHEDVQDQLKVMQESIMRECRTTLKEVVEASVSFIEQKIRLHPRPQEMPVIQHIHTASSGPQYVLVNQIEQLVQKELSHRMSCTPQSSRGLSVACTSTPVGEDKDKVDSPKVQYPREVPEESFVDRVKSLLDSSLNSSVDSPSSSNIRERRFSEGRLACRSNDFTEQVQTLMTP